MEIKFCRRCGAPVKPTQVPGGYQCANRHRVYYKSYAGVLMTLLNPRGQVLVAVRGLDPGKGTLDLPGGFLDPKETLEEAVRREVQEETGLRPNDYTQPQYLCSALDTYEYQGEVQPGLAIVFWARTTKDVTLRPQDDVAELKWTAPEDVDPNEVYAGFNGVRAALAEIQQKFG